MVGAGTDGDQGSRGGFLKDEGRPSKERARTGFTLEALLAGMCEAAPGPHGVWRQKIPSGSTYVTECIALNSGMDGSGKIPAMPPKLEKRWVIFPPSALNGSSSSEARDP